MSQNTKSLTHGPIIINHDGDTWRIVGIGTRRDGKAYCHLASTTRKQRNGNDAIQIADWIDEAVIEEGRAQCRRHDMTRKRMRVTIPVATFKDVLCELNRAGIPWSLVDVVNSVSDFELVADGTPTGFIIHLEDDNSWSASALIDLPVEA